MSLERIELYLRESTGLDSSTVGLSVVEQAIRARMEICGLEDLFAYYEEVKESQDELQALINAAMIPETWFFRGQEPFEYLRSHVLSERMQKKNDSTLRVLTIPCSTGEEPYSIAITLKECGLKPSQFTIDAVDISTQSLEAAKKGIYSEHSFRGTDDLFRKRYFKSDDDGYHLKDEIRGLVNFVHGNILSSTFFVSAKHYDIVFCRNLLIYFDRFTQNKALEKIYSLLKQNGILFIGHGEAGCMVGQNYQRTGDPSVFAYVKTKKLKVNNKRRPALTPSRDKNKRTKSLSKPTINKNRRQLTELDKNEPVALLEDAKQLADQGRLEDAMEKCHESVQREGVSAEALYLQGVISDAQGNKEVAEQLYKKALYLCPNHFQALMHLASHAERSGNMVKAELYRNRATRSVDAGDGSD